ncbi:hypothetical protein CF319_g4567 [Tilletia indica]|nr:hypothetical protein CF319_g4567 [Tilletia indica]
MVEQTSQLAGEAAIRARTEQEKALALEAIPDDGDEAFALRMATAIQARWDRILEDRLSEYREQIRLQEEAAEALRTQTEAAERVRREEELRLQTAAATVANLRDAFQAQAEKGPDDSSAKVIEMEEGRDTAGPFDAWVPSYSTIKKIRDGDYTFDMWYLTPAGVEAERKAKEQGGAKLKLENGELEMDDRIIGKTKDEDLPDAVWVSAIQALLDWARRLGRPEGEVEGLAILNSTLLNHKELARFSRAFKIWHRRHRTQWHTSHLGKANNKRDDLRIMHLDWWPQLRTDELERQRDGKFEAALTQISALAPVIADRKRSLPVEAGDPATQLPALMATPLTSPAIATVESCSRTINAFPAITSTSSKAAIGARAQTPTAVSTAAPQPTARLPAAPPAPTVADSCLPTSPTTPLCAKAWSAALHRHQLHSRFPHLVTSIQHGFHIGIPPLTETITPPNHSSAKTSPPIIEQLITTELRARRYAGPFSSSTVQQLIGPFQTSPLGIIPKKPSGHRLIQDFSFPRNGNSINSLLKPADWPTTWGAARHACNAILLLPPTALAAVRDVDSAFRLIPLHPSQWPGTVLHDDDGHYYIDFCLGFGISPAPGAWGLAADALADILRRSGAGVVIKWVDDYLFLTIPLSELPTTNAHLRARATTINPTPISDKGSLSYIDSSGNHHSDDGRAHFINLTNTTSPTDPVTSLAAIDAITRPLGVPWKAAKDKDFAPIQKYVGFLFDIPNRTVSLPEDKRTRYLDNVLQWLSNRKHTPAEAEELLGRLQHSSFVYTAGRKRLAYLRVFLRLSASAPRHVPRYPPRQLASDLNWWASALSNPATKRSFLPDHTPIDLPLYTDASTDFGLGITVGNAQLSLPLKPHTLDHGRGIVWAELLAIELGLRTAIMLGVADAILLIHSDNQAGIAALRTGHMRNEAAMIILQRIRELEALHNLEVRPRYVSSPTNPADPPSRGLYTTHQRLPLPPLPVAYDDFFDFPLLQHCYDG